MVNNKVFLITSGAYANVEITSDFGLLPTSFLPIGHKRLFELQIETLSNYNCTKVITLPDDYKLLKRDEKFLLRNNIIVFRNNPNLSLSESILRFFDHYEKKYRIDELYILHGDTSFNKVELKPDLLYYGFTDMFYKWGNLSDITGKIVYEENYKQPVIAGYFSFSSPIVFKEQLLKTKSFELALKNYHKHINFNVVLKSGWLDFGHSNLYYKSKMELNVTRNFNQVVANTNYIKKTSNNSNKIQSEYEWFRQLPKSLTLFTPSVWGFRKKENKSSYKIEFIGAPTLQEKWVFGTLPDFVYYNIINQIFIFIIKSKKVTFDKVPVKKATELLEKLYLNKTKKRIKEFSINNNFSLEEKIIINNKKYPSLKDFSKIILETLQKEISKETNQKLTLMHGDLCFSNILSDTRSNIIKLIDPRGGLDNNFDSRNKIIGDFKYDVAKLGHSLVGNYDYIVTGFYDLEKNTEEYSFNFKLQHNSRRVLIDYFYKKVLELDLDKNFIKASIVNLFISMLPLHDEDEDRQLALLLNAYQLFYD